MPTHLDQSSLTAARPYLIRLVSLLSGVDWPLASPFANSFLEFPCPTPLAFPYPLPVMSRSWAQAFVWFRAKTDKEIVCLADHLQSATVLSLKVLRLYSFPIYLGLSSSFMLVLRQLIYFPPSRKLWNFEIKQFYHFLYYWIVAFI